MRWRRLPGCGVPAFRPERIGGPERARRSLPGLSSRTATLGRVTVPTVGVHVGAREDDADPVAEAARSGADAVQIFLADPQGWKTPKAHPHADELRESDLQIYVHAPYIVNVATTNNRIRIPSRKLLGTHAVAAAALVTVHDYYAGRPSDVRRNLLLILHAALTLAVDDPAATRIDRRHVELSIAEGEG